LDEYILLVDKVMDVCDLLYVGDGYCKVIIVAERKKEND